MDEGRYGEKYGYIFRFVSMKGIKPITFTLILLRCIYLKGIDISRKREEGKNTRREIVGENLPPADLTHYSPEQPVLRQAKARSLELYLGLTCFWQKSKPMNHFLLPP